MEVANTPAEVTNADTDTNTAFTPDDGLSKVEQLMGRLSAHVAAEEGDAPPADDAPEDEPAQAAEEAPAEAEPEVAEAKPEPAKADDRIEIKHGRALQKIVELEGKFVGVKQERDELKGRVDKFLTQAKANPLALIEELYGDKFEAIMTKAAAGEFDKPPEAKLPPELQAQLDRLAKYEKEETARRETETKAKAREADLTMIRTDIQARAEEFPFSNLYDFVPDEILDEAYAEVEKGKKPNLYEIAKRKEAMARDTIRNIVTNDKALALLAQDKEVRDSISKAFGGLSEPGKSPTSESRTTKTAPKQPNVRTLPNSTEIPTRTETPDRFASRDEEIAESVRLLSQHIRAGQL